VSHVLAGLKRQYSRKHHHSNYSLICISVAVTGGGIALVSVADSGRTIMYILTYLLTHFNAYRHDVIANQGRFYGRAGWPTRMSDPGGPYIKCLFIMSECVA